MSASIEKILEMNLDIINNLIERIEILELHNTNHCKNIDSLLKLVEAQQTMIISLKDIVLKEF